VLDLVERRDRREPARALGRLLDVEPQAVPGSERGEAPVASVGDDRGQVREARQLVAQQIAPRAHIVRLGRIDPDDDRQPEDLDQDAALGPTVRPPRPPALWKVGPKRPLRTVWASIITIEGWGLRLWRARITCGRRAMAFSQTPLSRQRRHCCQTASQGG